VILFVDTSALVRRYDLTEPGSPLVVQLCRPAAGNDVTVLAITSVEVFSALQRKLREDRIDRMQRDRMWRLFLAHRRAQYRVVALDSAIYRRAQWLLSRHPLRAYDAVQLAGALLVARSLPAGADYRFCTADQAQALAATSEGLAVELIT
jgi:predicted nucleic acid-binding protein